MRPYQRSAGDGLTGFAFTLDFLPSLGHGAAHAGGALGRADAAAAEHEQAAEHERAAAVPMVEDSDGMNLWFGTPK